VDEAEIMEAIRLAFADVQRGTITIHEAEVIDSYGATEERQAARQRDTGASWKDVPDEEIQECTWALPHLDPESWRFYIPAYMTWALKHFRVSDAVVSDFTIYTFALSGDESIRSDQLERYALLSEQEAKAVCCFLRFMAANGDHADDVVAGEALEGYWGRFCAEAPDKPAPG
jgi:hypothetical protein